MFTWIKKHTTHSAFLHHLSGRSHNHNKQFNLNKNLTQHDRLMTNYAVLFFHQHEAFHSWMDGGETRRAVTLVMFCVVDSGSPAQNRNTDCPDEVMMVEASTASRGQINSAAHKLRPETPSMICTWWRRSEKETEWWGESSPAKISPVLYNLILSIKI